MEGFIVEAGPERGEAFSLCAYSKERVPPSWIFGRTVSSAEKGILSTYWGTVFFTVCSIRKLLKNPLNKVIAMSGDDKFMSNRLTFLGPNLMHRTCNDNLQTFSGACKIHGFF